MSMIIAALKRLLRSERGVTAIEAAILLPAFIYFIFGITELSRMFWVQTTLDYAVAEAARYAIVNSAATSSQIQGIAVSRASPINATTSNFNVTITAPGSDITINGTYNFTFLVIPISNKTLSSTSHYSI